MLNVFTPLWTCDSCYWYLFVKDLTGELVIHIVLNITSGRLINAFVLASQVDL